MKRIILSAAVATAALTLAACGSSGGDSSSGAASTPSAQPTFTGTEIKVGIIADTSTVSALGNPQPEVPAAAQAHIDVINAAGGIKRLEGRPRRL